MQNDYVDPDRWHIYCEKLLDPRLLRAVYDSAERSFESYYVNNGKFVHHVKMVRTSEHSRLSCCVLIAASALLPSSRGMAEVTLDGSLGVAKSLQGPNYEIKPEYGLIKDRNLFHSFGQFNIDAGQTASFLGAQDISNIIGRVTGGSEAKIFGRIESTSPNTNLWLLNPAGFLFGPGASVNVAGSFYVSTANYLKLGEGGVFNAQPNAGDVLTTADPEAFEFLDSKPAAVDIVGNGASSGTILAANNQLGIVAGSVNITDGSAVFGFKGVSIGAIEHTGEIGRDLKNLDPETAGDLGSIALKSNANVLTQGSSITIRGWDLTVENSTIGTPFQAVDSSQSINIGLSGSIVVQGGASSIQTATDADGPALDIAIKAREISIRDSASIFSGQFGCDFSGFCDPSALSKATGRAGNIAIFADHLRVTGNSENSIGGVISSTSVGRGKAGDIILQGYDGAAAFMDELALSDFGGINSFTGNDAPAGNITVRARHIVMQSQSRISASTSGTGSAGTVDLRGAETLKLAGGSQLSAARTAPENAATGGGGAQAGGVFVDADDIELIGQSLITTSALEGSLGDADPIVIKAHRLHLDGGASVSAPTLSTGKGGDIRVNADWVELIGTDAAPLTSISSATLGKTSDSGAGGSITIEGRQGKGQGILAITGNAGISGITQGPATASNINVDMDEVRISDRGRISGSTLGSGRGGEVTVNARTLELSAGGDIVSESGKLLSNGNVLLATGDAGDIRVRASESLRINGTLESGALPSGISSGTYGDGRAGSVAVGSPDIELSDRGRIASDTGGDGPAGSVTVNADQGQISLSGGAEISSRGWVRTGENIQAGRGSAGEVAVTSPGGTISVTGNGSAISTDSLSDGNAGKVTIDANTVSLDDGGAVRSTASKNGEAGAIAIRAADLNLSDTGKVDARTKDGTGGSIDLRVQRLAIRSGGSISTSSSGSGEAGNISIHGQTDELAESVTVDGFKVVEHSGEAAPSVLLSNIRLDSAGVGKSGVLDLNSRYFGVSNDAQVTAEARGKPSGGSGGDIAIRAETVDLLEGGRLSASTAGGGQAGQINISASQAVNIRGHSSAFNSAPGGIASGAVRNAETGLPDTGQGGSVAIVTPRLALTNGGEINASTEGNGDAGNVVIRGGELTLAAGGSIRSESGTAGATDGIGNSGRIDISLTGPVTSDAGEISTRSRSRGNAGQISIETAQIALKQGNISSTSEASGNAGSVLIRSRDGIRLSDRSSIATTTIGAGTGGTIQLHSNRVRLEGGSIVSTTPIGNSDAADIIVRGYDGKSAAAEVDITGGSGKSRSGFRLNTEGEGRGGLLDIQADRVNLSDNGELSATAGRAASSSGGTIKVAAGTLALSDGGRISASTAGKASGGGIVIRSNELQLGRNSEITVTSSGAGDAGQIDIDAGERLISRGGRITAEAEQANGGNITLKARERIQLEDSAVKTSVRGGSGPGGNISIDPDFVILKNSRIVANANQGPGGNITITGNQLIQDSESIIDASSRAGINGQVVISAPDTNMIGKIAALTAKYLDPATLFRERCAARYVAGESRLTVGHVGQALQAPGEGFFVNEDPEFAVPRNNGLSCDAGRVTAEM